MKKVLFATTALIATAGVASADVTVGGYGFLGATFDGSTNTTTVSHKMRVTFKGSVETDSGIKFTAASRMNISDTTKDAAANALERGKITMSSGGLTLAVGATNGAMKSLARVASYQGFNDGGVVGMDSNTSTLNDSGNNIYIGYAAGDFKVAVGADIAGTTQDIAASYTVNSFTIGAGADSNNEWMIAASYDGGNWSAALGANSDNDIVLKAGYDISRWCKPRWYSWSDWW